MNRPRHGRPQPSTVPEWQPLRRAQRRNGYCGNGAAARCCIAWRDIAGRAAVQETLHAASEFADAAILAAVEAARNQLRPAFGEPRDGASDIVPLIVVGMGKLGGRELNFSSDIDLVLLYPAAGTTDGAQPIDNAEYFDRLGRELIRLLDARTGDGFVFRVDMRLRPYGDSGGLVVSTAALEDYLQQHGRDWERYAWIKARGGRRRSLSAALCRMRPAIRVLEAISPGLRHVRLVARNESAD